ncbi:MAG: oligoendopeptidase F [Lachnospiraceae bacterium]|nr:oligoendopeptidase F [Lachnospiraceae bacterium]
MCELLKKREEVKAEDKWAIEDLFETDEDWEKEYNELEGLCQELVAYKGKLFANVETFSKFFEKYETAKLYMERVYVYAGQKNHEDTTNSKYQGLSDRASALMTKYHESVAFVEPEILETKDEVFQKIKKEFLAGIPDKADGYERFFSEILRSKDHSLPAEMEELLASGGEALDAASTIFSMFNNADIKFPSITGEKGQQLEVTHGKFIQYLQSKDRRIRREAFQSVYSMYEAYKNTLAATFIANLKKDVFYARARKYASVLAMKLDGSQIPEEVYHNLITVVQKNLPQLHRYMDIRKRLLGVDNLHMYDLYVPMVEADMDEISYEEAKNMVLEGLAPLGEEYKKLLQEGFNRGWIDVYENVGKRSGAYSWGAYGTHPYVLLNHQNNLNSVFTLAHEMGHALHSYYSDKNQSIICAGYEIFVAEVASTCNEALLIHYLLQNTKEKKKRAYLINYYLEQFRTTLFRQTMFAEFEWMTHSKIENGEALTTKALCDMYHQLNQKYFGNQVEIDEEIDMEWARIPHFYTSYYVYQYATGYSAAIALSAKILKEGESAVKNYIEKFLCGGGSKDPITLLKGAGVDMSKQEPIQQALDVFVSLLDEMEELMK